MAVAEIVLKYIQALVWPLVTLCLVWVLRRQRSNLNDFCADVLVSRSGIPPRKDTEIARALKAFGLSDEGGLVFDRLALLSKRAEYEGDTVTRRAAFDFLDSCEKMADLVSELVGPSPN